MLVAYSHLRWGFVWQRPQHLLSRFARSMPVTVVEEPEYGARGANLRVQHHGNVTVLTPLIPDRDGPGGFGAHCNKTVARLIEPFIADAPQHISWYYTPMALGAEPAAMREAAFSASII